MSEGAAAPRSAVTLLSLPPLPLRSRRACCAVHADLTMMSAAGVTGVGAVAGDGGAASAALPVSDTMPCPVTPTDELWRATVAAVALKDVRALPALLRNSMPLLLTTLRDADVPNGLKRYAYTFVRTM